MALSEKEFLDLYEGGKQRRYNLLFSVNGGAFAIAKLMEAPENVLGGLSLRQLSLGMTLFTIIMVADIFVFGISKKKKNQDVFTGVGMTVLFCVGALICAGWLLVGFG